MSLLTSAGGVRVFDILFYKYLSMFLQKQEIGSEVPFSEVLNTEKYEAALSQIANHKIKLSYAPLSDLALDLDNEWKLYLYQKRYEEIGRIIGDQAEEK